MSQLVYLDHNIVDDISKGRMTLKPSGELTWVYSSENLNEILRSGDTRFLDVYEEIRARKIDLVLDANFRMTGRARICEYVNPHEVYKNHVEAINNPTVNNNLFLKFIARLHGADNYEEVQSLPEEFEQQIKELLQPIGRYDEETKTKVEKVSNDLRSMINGKLQEIGKLEIIREKLKAHKGRMNRFIEHDNPLEEIWNALKDDMPGITADRLFGFDPVDKQGYEEWPLFLGVVGCHAFLNFIGFKPDSGLAKVDDLPRALSDGAHIAHGAYCHILFSRDGRLRVKARAIYKYKNISTQVLPLEAEGS